MARKKMSKTVRLIELNLAKQEWLDTKERLFDDYDFGRISYDEYQRKFEQARQEFLSVKNQCQQSNS